MNGLDNRTRLGAFARPLHDEHGQLLYVVCARATCRLPTPSDADAATAELLEDQPEPAVAARFRADPTSSSVIEADQTVFDRPGSDVVLVGHARSLRQRPVAALSVRVCVGEIEHVLTVHGDRHWERSAGGLRASEPEPFHTKELNWERAFGGADHESNPVGVGLYANAKHACGRPLPNLERPSQRIASWRDRPEPIGLGPVARHWPWRRQHAGTYDARWQALRAPFLPEDFDRRFFCAAPPGLRYPGAIAPGTTVRLEGVHADGAIGFRVPDLPLTLEVTTSDRHARLPARIDAIRFEPDEGRFGLFYRWAVPIENGVRSVRKATLHPRSFS